MRVLKDQFTQLARAIGNIFIPILMAIVPYVQVIVKWLTTLAQAIANFLGFELEIPDYSDTGIGDMSAGIDDIGDAASGASKEIKKMLAPFDELNVITFDTGDDSGSGAGASAGGGGLLDIPLPEYDALTGAMSKNLEEVEARLKSILPYVIAIGSAFAIWKIGSGIVAGIGAIKSLGSISKGLLVAQKIVGAIALAVGGIILFVTGIFDILDKTKPVWEGILKVVLGIAAVVGGVLLAGASAAVAIGVAIAGAVIGAIALIVRYWEEIKTFFIGLAEWFSVNVITPIVEFFQGLWQSIKDIFNGIVKTIKDSAQAIWDGIVNTIGPIINWLWTTIVNPILEIITLIVTKVAEIIAKIVEIIVTLLGVIAKWVWNNVISPVINFFIELGEKIGEIIQGAWNTITSIFGKIASWVSSNVINPVTNFFKTLGNNIANVVKGVWNNITSTFKNIVSWINNNVVNPIKNAFSKAWNFVANSLGGVIKGVVNGILWTVERFINNFISGLNNVVGIINKIPGVNIGYVSYLSLPRFAEGGFPEKGELFIANEAGPELVGSIGNRAVVANNGQIIEGIKQGVIEAMSAVQGGNNGNGKTIINIGNKKVYEGYGSYINSKSNRYGTNLIRV